MTVQAFIVLTGAQKTAAEALNDPDNGVEVAGQLIANSLANNLGFGTLVGQYVIPARVLNDPTFSIFVPTLGTLPTHVLDSETLFVASPD